MGKPLGENYVHLVVIIRDLLTTRHGALYASDKTEELRGMHTLEVFDWAMVYLDGKNQRTLAEKLGISVSDFDAVRRVFAGIQASKG